MCQAFEGEARFVAKLDAKCGMCDVCGNAKWAHPQYCEGSDLFPAYFASEMFDPKRVIWRKRSNR